jgi:VIT1/CCC1 family predicted Fe2+/Mn2+ transporter
MLVGAITAIAFLFTMSAGWLAVTAFCAFLLALAIQFAYIGRRHSRE